MFGFEKKNKKQKPFEFDLEKDLKSKKSYSKELLDKVGSNEQTIKQSLKDGSASENFDQCGILLQGYHSLKKVIDRVCRK
ncbi:needle chaperone SctE [Candidatus Aerophobetes bacterium]|uniref:Needle chaperone SctE n=1 Tax=Aerophobetes bacterium TaxID=2030807 RepID=A0A2A4X4S0_UNCAE|nr:MAG: needle chaperone SctE [Candidatus Aerophobetes bacterium]